MINAKMADIMGEEEVNDASAKSETETETTPTSTESTDVKVEEPKEESTASNGEDKKANDKPTNVGKQTHTDEEKRDYAFARLKQKSKDKIKKLNAEIAELKKKLESTTQIKRSDYDDDESYLDAKLDKRDKEREIKEKQSQIDDEERELRMERNRNRFVSLYPTEESQREFSRVWNLGEKNGIIRTINEDEVISTFLQDSDLCPRLIEHFIRKPEVLQKMMDLPQSRKQFEMYNLEQRMSAYLKRKSSAPKAQAEPKETTEVGDAKGDVNKAIGKQVSSKNPSSSSNDFNNDKELFQWIRKH